jgi:hypothetical protein
LAHPVFIVYYFACAIALSAGMLSLVVLDTANDMVYRDVSRPDSAVDVREAKGTIRGAQGNDDGDGAGRLQMQRLLP